MGSSRSGWHGGDKETRNPDGDLDARPVPRGKPGRPRTGYRDLNASNLRRLCRINVTIAEAAAFFDVTEEAFEIRLRREPELREAWERGRADGTLSLRRAMMRSAVGTKDRAPNVTAQIWVSKNVLGWADRSILETVAPSGNLGTLSDAEIVRLGMAALRALGQEIPADLRRYAETHGVSTDPHANPRQPLALPPARLDADGKPHPPTPK